VQVNTGAVLGGSGTVGDVTDTGGTISPVTSPNVLHTGSLTSTAFDPQRRARRQTRRRRTPLRPGGRCGAVNLRSATLSASIGGGYTPTPGDQLTDHPEQQRVNVTGTFTGMGEGGEITVSGSSSGSPTRGRASTTSS